MEPALRRRCAALGVTRLARLTALDRTGVEVFGAVRPGGHVLQVTQGKGTTRARAIASALGEAAELLAAERVPTERLVWRDGRAWTEARALGTGERVLVPAELVWCPPAGEAWLGPARGEWTSNGLGAHRSRAAAVEHGALEVVERDALARVLPDGFTGASAARLLRWTSPLAVRLARAGFSLFTFDLTPPRARLPVAGALLFDVEGAPVPLTAGYACRRAPEAAVEAAVLEAAQSRLTEIHGARDDVAVGEREAGGALRALLASARPRRDPRTMPRWRGPLHRAVPNRLLVVDLADAPLTVVKVLGEGLLRSRLL